MEKVKVYYISDMHLDVNNVKSIKDYVDKLLNDSYIYDLYYNNIESDKSYLDYFKDDLLVIAGDTSNYNEQIIGVLKEFSNYFDKICFICGNHELYLTTKSQSKKFGYDSLSKIKSLYKLIKDDDVLTNVVHFLGEDYDGILEYKGKKIAGEVMFSNPYKNNKYKNFYKNIMNDYRYIKFRQINNDITSIDILSRKNLRYYKILSQRNLNLDLFISHYPIVITNSHLEGNRMSDGSLGSFYCDISGVEYIAKNNIYGHTHEVGLTTSLDNKFYSNAVGYRGEGNNLILKSLYI